VTRRADFLARSVSSVLPSAVRGGRRLVDQKQTLKDDPERLQPPRYQRCLRGHVAHHGEGSDPVLDASAVGSLAFLCRGHRHEEGIHAFDWGCLFHRRDDLLEAYRGDSPTSEGRAHCRCAQAGRTSELLRRPASSRDLIAQLAQQF
jgi:hypothetical protein